MNVDKTIFNRDICWLYKYLDEIKEYRLLYEIKKWIIEQGLKNNKEK